MSSKKKSFVSVGDLCIDHYVNGEKYFLGGCAFNTAYYATYAGLNSSIISSIGNDKYGNVFLEKCKNLNIDTKFVGINAKFSTATIDVILEDGIQEYKNLNVDIFLNRKLKNEEKELLKNIDIAHSVLFKSTLNLFEGFSTLELPNTLKSGDFSGIYEYSFSTEAVEKYGENLDVIVKSLDIENKEEINFLKNYSQKFGKLVLILLGKNGSLVFFKNKEYRMNIKKSKVIDTSGAGDGYISAFLAEYKKSGNIEFAMEKGTETASEIVSFLGANPILVNIT